ncbi:MAG: diguanylate cyclase [Bacteroidota bacterium]
MSKINLKYVLFSLLILTLFYILLNFITINSPAGNHLYWAVFTTITIVVFFTFFLVSEWRSRGLKNKIRKLNMDLNKAIFDIMALFEFTNVLGSDLRLTQMMELMVDTIKRIHFYDGCCLCFYSEQHQSFSIEVNRGFPEKLNKTNLLVRDLPGESLVKSGQAFIVNNIDEEFSNSKIKEPQIRELLGEFSSFVFLPLMVDRKLTGLLVLAKYTEAAFEPEDLRLLLIISNQAGLAIQNRRLYEQAYYSAITDGLTGIYNQKYFREQLDFQLEKAKEYGFKISLILIDIDHFKKFNDTYGHQIGDRVLKEVSKVIQDCVNPDSLVARYGGEEFVVILPDTSTKDALILAEKIRSSVESKKVKTREYSDLHVTVSLGLATFPDHIKNMGRMVVELIDRADENLYTAKNTGRNRVYASDFTSKS